MCVNNLKTHRLNKQITQEEMAERLEISIPAYNLYENEKRLIPVDVAEKIAMILGEDISSIFLCKKFAISKSN